MEPYFFFVENTWCPGRGWGNGYIALPQTHGCFGMRYKAIPANLPFPLTLSEPHEGYWIIGFHTNEAYCRPWTYDREKVKELTIALFRQFFDTEPVEGDPPASWLVRD